MNYFPGSFIHPNPATFDSPQRQYFSIPFAIISYISKNPISAKGLLKLQKTCKYFFAKNKIIVVNKAVRSEDDHILYCHLLKNSRTIYLSKAQYWLNLDIIIYDSISLDLLLTAIYRCTLRTLVIHKQNLTLDEFNFLSNGGKIAWLRLKYVNIRNVNGALISCDHILGKFRNIQSFEYACKNEIFTNETFEKMNDLKFNSKLKDFELSIFNISSDADFLLLCNFIEKNSRHTFYVTNNLHLTPLFVFHLKMDNAQFYKNQFNAFVNEIFQRAEFHKKPRVRIC